MCSLFDYIANRLSKDKNVELSVNINHWLQYFPSAPTLKLSHLRKVLVFGYDVKISLSLSYGVRLCKSQVVVKRLVVKNWFQ